MEAFSRKNSPLHEKQCVAASFLGRLYPPPCLLKLKRRSKGTVFEIAKRRFPRLNHGQSVFAAVTAALHFFGLRLPFDP